MYYMLQSEREGKVVLERTPMSKLLNDTAEFLGQTLVFEGENKRCICCDTLLVPSAQYPSHYQCPNRCAQIVFPQPTTEPEA